MPNSLKPQWAALLSSQPGHRFQDRHEHIKQSSDHNGVGARVVRFIVAAVSFVIGLVLTVIPGPAVLFFLITAGLLASESLVLARWLDGGEVWARRAGLWAHDAFRRLPLAGKVAVGCGGFLLAGVGAWLAYTTVIH